MKTRRLLFAVITLACLLFGSCAKDVIDLTGSIKGTVKNTKGPFIENCIISLNPTGKSQVTNTNGTFEFENLDPASYTLTFTKEGYSNQQKNVEVLSGKTINIDVVLVDAYGAIKGLVKNSDGISMDGCIVSLNPIGKSQITDTNGCFEFTKLPPGSYTLTFKKEDYSDSQKVAVVSVGETTNVDVVLIDAYGAIKGLVKKLDGTFIEGCIVSLNPTGKSQVTGNNGSFEFLKLPPDNYSLTFSKVGYSDQEKRTEVVLGEVANIDVILESVYGTIKGFVKDKKDGHTIENCQISLSPGGITKMTGVDGAFVFDKLNSGEYIIAYKKDGYVDETKAVTITSGQTVDADAALRSAYGTIKGAVKDIDNQSGIGKCLVSISPGDQSLMTEEDGSFTFERFPIGEYTLEFKKTGYSSATKRAKVEGGEITDIKDVWLKLENPFSVSVESIRFSNSEEVKDFSITNNSDGNCTFEFQNIPSWLSISPQQGTIEKQTEKDIKLTVDREKADYGEHTKDVKIQYSGRVKGEISVKVIMEKIKLTKPEVTITSPTNITKSGFDIGGNIKSLGGSPILDYGHCISRSGNPSIEDENGQTYSCGKSEKETSFSNSITGLESNTTYYVRAYARNAQGVSYSDQREVITLDALTKPEVSTYSSASNITETSFSIGGSIESTGGTSITDYGHCWNVYGTPTINDSKASKGSRESTGSFTSNITGLESNTTYYVRAYAVNSKGVSYGKQITVTTKREQAKPEVTISSATNITEQSFEIGGNIVSTGGLTIDSYGHCWSTYENPTINDNKNDLGRRSSTGSFSSNITGLKANTTYYVRAFAENEDGISYSQQMEVTTLESYGDKWDGNIASGYAGGSGTIVDPYIIKTGGQLLYAFKQGKGYLKLANDIDLNNHNWKPYSFNGSFDGDGHTISNLYINRTDNEPCGLVRNFYGGEISNLTIRGVNIKSTYGYTGAIAGSGSTLSNCHLVLTAGSKIEGCKYVGGLMGYGSNVKITHCSVTSLDSETYIYGTEYVGGICGRSVKATDCHVSCNIYGGSCVGGIVGIYGSVEDCSFQGNINGETEVGGIMGYADNSKIIACKVVANIEGEEYVGGICGWGGSQNGNITIIACYSEGNISSTREYYVSGILGKSPLYGDIILRLSYTTMLSEHFRGSPLTSAPSLQEDCFSIYGSNNITQDFKEAYSDYANYWNFNNQWTWSGTINGQTKQVKCPRLAWE